MGVLNKKTNRIAVAAVAALGEAHALNFYHAFGINTRPIKSDDAFGIKTRPIKSDDAFGIKTRPIQRDDLTWQLNGNPEYGAMTWDFVAQVFAPNEMCTPKDAGPTRTTKLGEGGFGTVQSRSLELWYKYGSDSCVRRPIVAQKAMKATRKAVLVTKMVIEKMFLSPLSTFQHGVVPILAKRLVGDNLEVVMPKAIGSLLDLLKGKTANWSLQNNPSLAKQLIEDIRGGISFMHEKNVAHLDIKPDNILLFEEKEAQTTVLRAKLADFDLAEDLSLTTTTQREARLALRGLKGTPGYISLGLAQMSNHIEMYDENRLVTDVLKDADWWAFHCVYYNVVSAIVSRFDMLFGREKKKAEFEVLSQQWKHIVSEKVDGLRRNLASRKWGESTEASVTPMIEEISRFGSTPSYQQAATPQRADAGSMLTQDWLDRIRTYLENYQIYQYE